MYCSSTGVLIFESTAGLETSFRIKSTPSVCYDRVECVAEDTVLPLSGSASAAIIPTGEIHIGNCVPKKVLTHTFDFTYLFLILYL